MYKKLASHTLIYGLSPYIPRILGLFILPIITKDLTDFDYGVYGIILAYITAIEVLKDLGLNLILYNSFTKMPHQYKWMWRSIYGFLTIWNLVYAILALGLIYIAVPTEARDNVWLIAVLNVLPIVFFGPTAVLGKIFFQMKEMPVQIAVRTIIFGILTILLNLYTISYLKLGYMGWFWTTCIIGFLTNLSFWYPINITYKLSPIFNFKRRLLKKSLKISLPTVPHYYSNYIIQSSDKVILNVLNIGPGDIGGYNFAGMFGGYFSQLGNALGQAARPLFNLYYKEKNYIKVREIIFAMQLFFFTITFLVSIWLKEIFIFIVNNETLAATYPMAIILIMAINYRPMYFGSAGVILYGEKTNSLLKVTFVGALISVLLNFIGIPFLGIWAAVFSTYISMMYLGYSGYYLKEFKKINVNYYPMFWLLATLLLTGTAYYVVELDLLNKGVVSLILIIINLLVLKKLIKIKRNG